MAQEAIRSRRAVGKARRRAPGPAHATGSGIFGATRARGRHASERGEGLGRLLAWTTAGAVLPGLALLVAGRRKAGTVLLALVALAAAAVVALAATGRLADLGLKLAVRPNALLLVAAAAAIGGLIWAMVIVVGHRWLRRTRLRPGQQLLSFALVAALVAAVVIPAGTVARYALAQRSVVLNVFDEPATPRDPSLAAPDVKAVDPWADTPRINVLLIGSDAGADRTGTRPDTLIVASIDTHTGNTVLFSLPRNLQNVPFPKGTPGAKQWPRGFNCGDECLINAIWTWAEQNKNLFPGDPEPGLTATRQAVSETLGLSLDYYALVNLQGFIDVVDAMGGVEINVERKLPIGGITADGRRVKPAGYLMPGRRVLNGSDALWYARSRADSDNYDRMRRQQCVIGAAIDQADPVSLALAFPRLAASAERNVETDISGSELDAFVELGKRVKGGTVTSLPFTNAVITAADPDYAEIRAFVQKSLAAPPPATPAPTTSAPAPGATDTPSSRPTASGSPTTAKPNPDQAQDLNAVCG